MMKQNSVWTTRGFEGFARGTCGNAGHNLYVSRAGVLQRIHQYDLNGNGYADLVFCNSQNHWEKPPTYVYRDVLGDVTRVELASDGAWSGAVADLNGDGYDDLVLAMRHNGARRDLNAIIYYGSPAGLSESRQQQVPAPFCTAVAIGDFNGDGKPDLAFLSEAHVRLFYQSDLGFEPLRFVDLDIEGDGLGTADLDGDGYTDLIVRSEDGKVRAYWGGAGGIDMEWFSAIPILQPDVALTEDKPPTQAQHAEYVQEAAPLVQAVHLDGVAHVFVSEAERAFLIPVTSDRGFGPPRILGCAQPMGVAVGDVNGNGQEDLVLACREPWEDGECSWVYWGGEGGFEETRRTRLKSYRACDVAVADLDGDGCADIVLCQTHTAESFTTDSLVYRGGPNGVIDTPVHLVTEDARRVFVAYPSGDRQPQLIFVNHYARNLIGNINISIYFGGPEGFSAERRSDVPGWGAVEAISCDINDDGCVDLVLANASENSVSRDPGSYVFLNSANGFPAQPTWKLPTTRAHGACCADLNHDGYLDVIFGGFRNPELLIFHGTSGGFDTANPTCIRMEYDGVLYDEPRWIYLADLNNNGWLDLVVPQISFDRSFILWGGPAGFSMERCQVLSVIRGACARAADLTGNGYLDLIIGGHMPSSDGPHDSFVYIYWNGPDGMREDRRTLLPANTINSMTVADFNNDGLLDLFICSYHDGRVRDIDSYIYWNRKARGFSAPDRQRLFTHSASGCVSGDFNEDGFVDLAIAYHKVYGDHVGHSAVWWNGPDGFVEGRVTKLPTSGPHGMASIGPGNIVDRGPEEYYVSGVFKLPEGVATTEISWEAEIPAKTWVRAQLRFGDAEEALEKATWMGSEGPNSWFDDGQTVETTTFAGKWVQYRLALGATNSGSTPRVTEVNLHYEALGPTA